MKYILLPLKSQAKKYNLHMQRKTEHRFANYLVQ